MNTVKSNQNSRALTERQRRVRACRSTTLVALGLANLLLIACGESSGFQERGSTADARRKSVQAPAQATPASRTQREIRGYETPELIGTNSELIGGEPAVLPPPVDPTENSTVTTIEAGNKTHIGEPTGPVSSAHSALTCPGSIPFTDGSCIPTSPVFLWTQSGAAGLSEAIFSVFNDDCDPAGAVCKHLKEHAHPKGFRAQSTEFFRSFRANSTIVKHNPSAFRTISICHDGVLTDGTEKVIDPSNVHQSSPCTSVYETFVGLVTHLKGSVPVYKWTKGDAVFLSLSATDETASGYSKEEQPYFYVIPPM